MSERWEDVGPDLLKAAEWFFKLTASGPLDIAAIYGPDFNKPVEEVRAAINLNREIERAREILR